MGSKAERVVIGMDPHKRSATIELMTADEAIVGGGRFGTDRAGYAAMLTYGRQWTDRVWAVEGCAGIGKHIANRLLADGEEVVDVPPKLSARARVFATGQGRKTDATDAHSVALVGTRMAGLRPVVNDEQLAVLRILVDRLIIAGSRQPPTDMAPRSLPPRSEPPGREGVPEFVEVELDDTGLGFPLEPGVRERPAVPAEEQPVGRSKVTTGPDVPVQGLGHRQRERNRPAGVGLARPDGHDAVDDVEHGGHSRLSGSRGMRTTLAPGAVPGRRALTANRGESTLWSTVSISECWPRRAVVISPPWDGGGAPMERWRLRHSPPWVGDTAPVTPAWVAGVARTVILGCRYRA